MSAMQQQKADVLIIDFLKISESIWGDLGDQNVSNCTTNGL